MDLHQEQEQSKLFSQSSLNQNLLTILIPKGTTKQNHNKQSCIESILGVSIMSSTRKIISDDLYSNRTRQSDFIPQSDINSFQKQTQNNDNCWGYKTMTFQNRKNEQKQLYYKNLIQKFPSQSNSYYCLANHYKNVKKYDLAIIMYKKCVQMDGQFEQTCFKLAICYKNQSNYVESLKYFHKVTQINNNNQIAYLQIGDIYKKQNKLQNSNQAYLKALEINKNSYKTNYHIGIINQLLDNKEQAIKYYEQCIKLNPNYAEAYIQIGNILNNEDKLQQAKGYYLKAIKANHLDQNAYFNLGLLYEKLKLYDQAQKVYIKIININCNNYDSYYNLASLYFMSKNIQKSQQTYKKLIEINPSYQHAYLNLAVLMHYKKDYSSAKQYYLEYLQFNRNHIQTYLCIADIFTLENNLVQAQFYLRKAMGINSRQPCVYLHLGVLLYNKKCFSQAQQCYMSGIQLDGKNGKIFYNLGILYIVLKQYKKSQEQLQKAINLQPENPLYLMASAKISYILHNTQKSFQKLHTAKHIIKNSIENHINLQEKYDLNEGCIEWIRSTLQEVENLERVQKHKSNMSDEQLEIFQEINQSFFQNLEDSKRMVGENQEIRMIKRRLEILESQVVSMKQDVGMLKNQLEWDIKFQLLLQKQRQLSGYFKNLYTILSVSIQAYRAVHIGIVQPGFNIIKSKVGGFLEKINKILGLGKDVPIVSSFCSVIVSIGQFYLQQQSGYVVSQIVGATDNLYNEKKVSKATNEAILFLAESKDFMRNLRKNSKQSQGVWYKNLLKKFTIFKQKAQKLKSDILTKTTNYGGHNISDEMNLAMQHCAQILITMINYKNKTQIQQASNPLKKAVEIWLQSIKKEQKQNSKISILQQKILPSKNKLKQPELIRLSIFKANLTKNKRLFGKMDPYCKIIYKDKNWMTDIHRNGHMNPVWTCQQFILQKITNKINTSFSKINFTEENEIIFEVYDKNFMSSEDKLIGVGKVVDNIDQLKNISSIPLFKKGNSRGEIRVKFQ